MGTLEERVLSALMEGPKTFDQLKTELGTTDDELTEALEELKAANYISSTLANEFKWARV